MERTKTVKRARCLDVGSELLANMPKSVEMLLSRWPALPDQQDKERATQIPITLRLPKRSYFSGLKRECKSEKRGCGVEAIEEWREQRKRVEGRKAHLRYLYARCRVPSDSCLRRVAFFNLHHRDRLIKDETALSTMLVHHVRVMESRCD